MTGLPLSDPLDALAAAIDRLHAELPVGGAPVDGARRERLGLAAYRVARALVDVRRVRRDLDALESKGFALLDEVAFAVGTGLGSQERGDPR